MDEAILAVLDVYHGRTDDEHSERNEGSERDERRRRNPSATLNRRSPAVEPETGRLLNILARSQRAPHILELGTSYGYATIWLAQAARAAGGRLTTMELHDHKSAYARAMSVKAGLAGYVDFQVGNAIALIEDLRINADFVLIGLWTNLYVPCLEAVYPKLNPGAIIVANNMIRPRGDDDAERYIRAVRAKPGVTSLSLPVGSGLEISRYR
jgi:predicted O-methyltransferase YrrM